MRRRFAMHLSVVLSTAFGSASCSGLRSVVDPGPPPLERAMSAAVSYVALGSIEAARSADEAVNGLIERRIAEANAVVEGVVAVMRAVRRAVPRTRAVDEAAVGELDAALAHIEAVIAARSGERIWGAETHAKLLGSAAALIPEVESLLRECRDGRFADADVRYSRLIAAYDRFRADAIALSEASETRRFATWSGAAGRDREQVADAPLRAASGGAPAVDVASVGD